MSLARNRRIRLVKIRGLFSDYLFIRFFRLHDRYGFSHFSYISVLGFLHTHQSLNGILETKDLKIHIAD